MAGSAARRSRWLLAVPILAGLFSTTLFLSQGGFGGGHGRFDQAIFVLGVPGILLSGALAQIGVLPGGDLVSIVLVPIVLNVLLVWLIVSLVRSYLVTASE
jgi:hypothetical protein